MCDLIDRSKLPTIRITGYFENRLLEEVIGVLNDVIQKAPTVDAVPREEHELLLKRFRHLLESDFIRSFDAHDSKTGTYKRDISEADAVAYVIRCGNCKYSDVIEISNRWIGCGEPNPVALYCGLWNHITGVECFCSSGFPREVKADG